jgi:hypothetical protein
VFLADAGREGCTKAIMLAHVGSRLSSLSSWSAPGLATAVPGKVKTGGQTMEVTRLQIAKEGWKALGNEQWRG